MKTLPLFKWLLKPYPFNYSVKSKLLISVGFWLYIFLFLYIFQPLGVNGYDNILEVSFSFAFITFIIIAFMLFSTPVVFPDFFDEDKWTTGKMVFWFLVLL